MKYQLLEKCYKINFDKIHEGCWASEVSCYADSRSKAKVILLKKIEYYGWKHYITNDDITYINISVIREPESDLYLFEGDKCSIGRINYILEERKRLADLDLFLENPEIVYCYIKKNGDYYRSNHSGYTDNISSAGVYEKLDAVNCAKSCDKIKLIPINIEKHNEMIKIKIKYLEEKLIKV